MDHIVNHVRRILRPSHLKREPDYLLFVSILLLSVEGYDEIVDEVPDTGGEGLVDVEVDPLLEQCLPALWW